jgi:glycosyltransferase involved in cell wall biosynthesis
MSLRVLMVAPTFPLVSGVLNGGTQAASYYLCRALRQYEPLIDLVVVRPFAPIGTPGCLELDGIQVRTLPFLGCLPRRAQIVCGTNARNARIRKLAVELKTQIVHSQGMAGVARSFGSRAVFTLHGIGELDALHNSTPVLRWAIAMWMRLTEARWRAQLPYVIAISPYTRGFFPVRPAQAVWEIPNPVAESFFQVARRPDRGRVFSPSHMTPLKNCAALIRAFASAGQEGSATELRFAGSHQDSVYGRDCQRLAVACGVANRVRFLGLLNSDQLRAELTQASLVALASHQENAPMTLAEAMAAGVPVLATRVGGIPWMVQDGRSGRLIEPKDDAGLAHGLRRLLEEDDLGQMGANARRFAEEHFHPAVVARRTVGVYKAIQAEQTASALKANHGC